jgi:hypothetical protein
MNVVHIVHSYLAGAESRGEDQGGHINRGGKDLFGCHLEYFGSSNAGKVVEGLELLSPVRS